MSWEVLAVRYGTLASTRAVLHYNWRAYGEPDAPQSLDYYLYVLRDGERVVLVDTGFAVDSARRRGRTPLIDPPEAVARLGIAPEAVTDVVVTHLHYDHVGNLGGWPHARLHVPGAELDFWATDVAARTQFAIHVDPEPIAWLLAEDRAGRVARYDGPAEPVPGVSALRVGGHSPGQHVLLVRTGGRPVLLASDAVHLYDELERERPFAVFADLVEMYEGYALVRRLAAEHDAVVVPGHDPLVTERFAAVDADGLALRLG
ncbi:MAG TPA: N-acyl homoserine lactonase family protein [Solirubrobacteraceae bacterium]|nr:N-acyl homoserine lactonase family protein [Solirubrobacteraceae bacterium]